ncbi:MAG: DUF748 domain-containing protein [Candidatus Omnitrophica bacterium]|nr:DUF748 domain-containing protein [Candidatus Omnitrophota bacterium]
MKKKRYVFLVYFFLLAVIATAWIYAKRARLLGATLQPIIEQSLSRVLDMQVKTDGLHFDPVSGEISCEHFTIMNPREFSRTPHIDLSRISAWVNVRELFHKKVIIDEVVLGRLDYRMERIMFDGNTRSNCRVMSWHIKDFRKRHPAPLASNSETGSREKWQIEIKKIMIWDGSFYYRNRITSEDDDLQFKPLHGHLMNFTFPARDEKTLNQDVLLEGSFGKEHSVPFQILGKANLTASNIGFDLTGRISEGPVNEYRHYWSGLGVRVKDGAFTLDVKADYKNEYFDATNTLELKSLKLSPGKTVVSQIWGLPIVAVIKFLESEKMIKLHIPVHGDITDPEFEVSQAFRKAFRVSLKQHTRSSLGALKEGTSMIASGATKASEKIIAGVGAVTDIVSATTSELKQQVLPSNQAAGKK